MNISFVYWLLRFLVPNAQDLTCQHVKGPVVEIGL
jgi:hypothetical protein